ncbi:1-acyl-sn-glycerol-3-phosphate acyltransferase [Chlorogloeopsis sp. ULAP01]|uniref:1-acyl-sn-glycerol-3-phosphate acyltransferase n=1 Tax=Chlorogloeopsis sp. ULAP01 TaxID=3056483 RepID=UPI0025AA73A8|nr:1-acyl-sn-glycerol-3-phosphate acyltransferase [Chlorogloeopsis sp. ULAP01]MDM9379833.1 1-acyl-sn-glycerol-3-phosphate acyltransferase [Chlorogloeopsis sp. ULAP01]
MPAYTDKQKPLKKQLGWCLDQRDPKFIQSLMPIWEWLYYHYFHVQTSGWEHIPSNKKVLFVGSHNGGLAAPDMFMIMYDWFRRYGVEQPVYGLMHPTMWQVVPLVAEAAAKVGAVVAHPKMAIAALRSGASVLVYPGGAQDVFRPHSLRNKIYFANRHGFIKLALREEVPIVPVISTGAHDTLIVLTECYKIVRQLHNWGMPWLFGIDPEVFPIYLGLPWGLALGPLPNIPLPTPIHTRVCPPIVFERYGRQAASDREYVHACYELVRSKMQQELDNLVKES